MGHRVASYSVLKDWCCGLIKIWRDTVRNLQRRLQLRKLEWCIVYQTMRRVWWYLQPFRNST